VESRFKDQVEDQVKNELVLTSLQQVTEGGHFSAISEPDFDYGAVEVPADGPFVYEFNIEVRPDFETPNWDGLSLNRPSYQITDEVIDAQLARTLSRFKFLEAVDGRDGCHAAAEA
jgi:trigger factor